MFFDARKRGLEVVVNDRGHRRHVLPLALREAACQLTGAADQLLRLGRLTAQLSNPRQTGIAEREALVRLHGVLERLGCAGIRRQREVHRAHVVVGRGGRIRRELVAVAVGQRCGHRGSPSSILGWQDSARIIRARCELRSAVASAGLAVRRDRRRRALLRFRGRSRGQGAPYTVICDNGKTFSGFGLTLSDGRVIDGETKKVVTCN